MICEMQSTNQMWSIGISRTSRIESKYWSAPRRRATALPSGSSMSLSRSLPAISAASRGDAPALEQGDEEDAGRREVEHVLRAGVRGAAHFHDLQRAQQVAAPPQ